MATCRSTTDHYTSSMRRYGRRRRPSARSVGRHCYLPSLTAMSRKDCAREEHLQFTLDAAFKYTQQWWGVMPLARRAEDETAAIAALDDALLAWRGAQQRGIQKEPTWYQPLRSLVQAGVPMVRHSSILHVIRIVSHMPCKLRHRCWFGRPSGDSCGRCSWTHRAKPGRARTVC